MLPKKSIVCTLFESHYHHGVAALINSLHKKDFTGDIYAGHKGILPDWINSLPRIKKNDETNILSFYVTDLIQLHCISLTTNYHLTNFKPNFMLMLWNEIVADTDQLFYFDPDIILWESWSFFTEWAACGIAVCEDFNSPLSEYHPRRVAWRKYFTNLNICLTFKNPIYVNGGFIGLQDKLFLENWRQIQEAMAPEIGGLGRSSLTGPPLNKRSQSAVAPFDKTDQDALNAAIEAWNGPVSYIGKEAMAFEAGTNLLPHALGQPKPWQSSYLKQAIAGHPPRLADRAYWISANTILRPHSMMKVFFKQLELNVASLVGRFYRRPSI